MDGKYIEETLKRHEEWLNKHDKIYGEIKELAIQTARMVDEVKHLREDQNELKNRVNEIEEKPKKRYDSVVMQIITFVIGSILTIIAVKIGLK